MTLVALASAALIAMTPLAAAAQEQPAGATGPVDLRADAPGFEVGASTSLLAIFPGFGGFVSVPAGRRISLEAGVEILPWMIEAFGEGDGLVLLTQAQARIPWKTRPTSRWSFIFGVTTITVREERGYGGSAEWESQSSFLPHGGVSWQWQKSPRFDLRLDLTALALAPRVQVATVWHPKRGAQ